MAPTLTVGMSEAKTNFSRITANANRTGRSVTVFKNNRPWVEIRPLAMPEVAPAEYIEGPLPAETQESLDETRAMKRNPDRETFMSAEALFESLGI